MKRRDFDPLAPTAIVIVGEGRARVVAEFPNADRAAEFAQHHINAGKRVVFARVEIESEAR